MAERLEEFDKRYYRISQVSEILEIPISTLRFWENKFTVIKPKRSPGGTRLYTASDIEKIRMVYFLVKERGMKLEAAQDMIRHNQSGVSRRFETINRLQDIRDRLQQLLTSISTFRK